MTGERGIGQRGMAAGGRAGYSGAERRKMGGVRGLIVCGRICSSSEWNKKCIFADGLKKEML